MARIARDNHEYFYSAISAPTNRKPNTMTAFPYPSMRRSFDLRFYFVLGPDDTKGRPVEEVTREALEGGATFIQLRAKYSDASEITEMARRMADVIAECGKAATVPLVIDDRVDVAWQCRNMGIKVDGVHVGQTDMDPIQARMLLGDDAIIGLSVKTVEQAEAANTLPAGTIDYLGAGPLHLTATKPEAAAGQVDGKKVGLEYDGANAICKASAYPVVVGGGVHADDMEGLAETGADGWFVVSAIAAAVDPKAATKDLVERWIALRGDLRHGFVGDDAASDVAAGQVRSTLPGVLTVAGSDSSGGAGIQADLKTMMANGVFGMSAIAALTAQNTTGVRSIQNTDPQILADQIDMVFEDIRPEAVKIGMVSSAELISAIADRLTSHQARNIVLDPVMVATSGAKLIDDDAIEALTTKLFPLATVITPNMPETEALLEQTQGQHMNIHSEADMEQTGRILAEHFGCAVLVKGGHGIKDANDVLVEADGTATWFSSPRIDNPNTHGTGCTLSSAIASHLALGETLPQAIRSAKEYLTGALKAQLDLGAGSGPMDHAWKWR